MTTEEFKSNTDFVLGHKLKVKSPDYINNLSKGNFLYEYYKQEALDYSGKELVTSPEDVRSDRLTLYTGNRYETEIFLLSCLEFTNDNRKPSADCYKLVERLTNSGLNFFISTCGEMHGRSNYTKLTADVVHAILDKDGNSAITIPNCGEACDTLALSVVEELWNKGTVDASIDTGMSFIRREYRLYTDDEVKKKSFKY